MVLEEKPKRNRTIPPPLLSPGHDTLDEQGHGTSSWDIFQEYAENREDIDENLLAISPNPNAAWAITGHSDDGRFPSTFHELERIPISDIIDGFIDTRQFSDAYLDESLGGNSGFSPDKDIEQRKSNRLYSALGGGLVIPKRNKKDGAKSADYRGGDENYWPGSSNDNAGNSTAVSASYLKASVLSAAQTAIKSPRQAVGKIIGHLSPRPTNYDRDQQQSVGKEEISEPFNFKNFSNRDIPAAPIGLPPQPPTNAPRPKTAGLPAGPRPRRVLPDPSTRARQDPPSTASSVTSSSRSGVNRAIPAAPTNPPPQPPSATIAAPADPAAKPQRRQAMRRQQLPSNPRDNLVEPAGPRSRRRSSSLGSIASIVSGESIYSRYERERELEVEKQRGSFDSLADFYTSSNSETSSIISTDSSSSLAQPNAGQQRDWDGLYARPRAAPPPPGAGHRVNRSLDLYPDSIRGRDFERLENFGHRQNVSLDALDRKKLPPLPAEKFLWENYF